MTIKSLLDIGEDKDIALTAPARPSMSYAQLRAHIEAIGGQLAGKGLAAGDRVAIVLPNGPEMASAFLAVASYMSAAPLNPAYKQAEYEFYLEDLRPKLVIVGEGSTNPVIAAAAKLGIEVVEARVAKDAPAGSFTLFDEQAAARPAGTEDEALVLHTSGTTSRPKVVPLLQKNILASARNIAASLELDKADHCLNIMPLFHIHGLIAVLAASMGKGASVCCSAGFNALQFFDLAAQEKISWYSGVPTMHQAILLRAQRNLDAAKSLGLRFIRSSSASLPPAVFDALNAAFGCPVIEAYGMTEAAHQMTSNPLGKGRQKAGFVGIVTNPEVCILDTEGSVQPQGSEGEVSIRGENVTPGYENNDAANASSFTNGWFRTGDQGYFDADGYLKITGRLKEIINRGGEKISPLEVDNVLMEHPAIQQVVTFAVEDKMLGEDVAAAVVLAEGASLSEAELKEYANAHLAKFKVPKHIRFLDEIPKGATGKLQRIGLAEKLGL
ncbi:MAG: acyl--CoA ligase [Candidatus Puniceispirillaceae bacterium]|jgi:acyl-CoA synthetase (AMP-forming)/AMP-acid ligase II